VSEHRSPAPSASLVPPLRGAISEFGCSASVYQPANDVASKSLGWVNSTNSIRTGLTNVNCTWFTFKFHDL